MENTATLQNLEKQSNKFPIWDKSDISKSLQAVYQWTIQNAENHLVWYEKKTKWKRIGSQTIRFLSILLAGIGALCPLLDSTGALGSLVLSRWGYVFLAVAAGIAGFDYYFGYSSGWMRKIVTHISLEKALKDFQYDWAILQAKALDNSLTNSLGFLNLAKEFTSQIENIVKRETDSWVLEFQSNLNRLEKVLNTELEARKTGSIKIIVNNSASFDKVTIYFNDNYLKELHGVSETVIDFVAVGSYEIKVVGKKDDKETIQNKVVEVAAGSSVSAEFTLSLQ